VSEVTVYFNFDRTDDGFARNTWHDQVLCVVLWRGERWFQRPSTANVKMLREFNTIQYLYFLIFLKMFIYLVYLGSFNILAMRM
jgi:hypothetical protein